MRNNKQSARSHLFFHLIILGLTLFGSPFQISNKVKANAKPNIVMLMVDDLDVSTLEVLLKNGYMNNLKTHIIDRGVNFKNNFSSNPICCSSRATLLSGQYSHNHGVLSVKRPSLLVKLRDGKTVRKTRWGLSYWLNSDGTAKEEYNSLPVWLQTAGYFTGHIGKYMNGYGDDTEETYVPPGYDIWNGLVGASTYSMYGYSLNKNGQVLTFGDNVEDYQTDVLSSLSKNFVEQASQSAKPFALMLMPVAPHIESNYETSSGSFGKSIRPAQKYLHLVDGNIENGELPELDLKLSADEDDLSDKHPNVAAEAALSDQDRNALKQQYKDRMAALLSVDDMIGTLVESLKTQDKYDNTVIFFTSDNGWFYGEHRLTGKQWAYEESIRLPLIVASPNHVGRDNSNKPILNTDLAPTIVELAGAQSNRVMDGRSILPLLTNPQDGVWNRKRVFIENFRAGFGAAKPPTYAASREMTQTTDTLYVHYYSEAESLSGSHTFSESYNLASDPLQVSGELLPIQTQVTHDLLIEEFAKCSGITCQIAEDKDHSPLNACIVEYKSCPNGRADSLINGLGMKGSNYILDNYLGSASNTESCLARANEYANWCDHADPETRFTATSVVESSIVQVSSSNNFYTLENLVSVQNYLIAGNGRAISSGKVRTVVQNPITTSTVLYSCLDQDIYNYFLTNSSTCDRTVWTPRRILTGSTAYIWNQSYDGLIPFYMCSAYTPRKGPIIFNSTNCFDKGLSTVAAKFLGYTVPR